MNSIQIYMSLKYNQNSFYKADLKKTYEKKIQQAFCC